MQLDGIVHAKIVAKLVKYNDTLVTIAEDNHGQISFILILLHSSLYLNQLKLHQNNTIIIKEPYYKETKILKNKQKVLIVDNIYHNLILVKPEIFDDKNDSDDHKDEHINIESLKEKGNKYFTLKQYFLAIYCYSQALNNFDSASNHSIELKFKLLCNRSLCFINIKKYSKALIDAENALKLDKSSIKAKFRVITALNYMGKYLQAMKTVKSIDKTKIKSNSILNKFISLEQEIVIRYRESMALFQNDKHEKIDFALYPSFADPVKWQNVSDYIGKIKVKYIDKYKGRGIVAAKNIKAGEIILVEKVFAKGQHQQTQKLVYNLSEFYIFLKYINIIIYRNKIKCRKESY